ncbi:MAG: hypothetical protein LBQ92_00010 [Propionibacteriaceae bacterium]|nr:hypothetical protein [Propionibacteriaceae bacterium]
MIKRLFWVCAGVAIAALVLSKAPKTLGRLVGSRSAAGSAVDRVLDFFDDVKDAMAAREAELHEALDEVD